jgi:uncharacterized membrane protein YoaK (UPF0700 family)
MSSRFVELQETDKNYITAPEIEDLYYDDCENVQSDIKEASNSSTVPLHERHPLEFTVILIGTSALAFNAGFVNGFTYQFHNTPVSHVTGTTTHAGIYIGLGDWNNFAINFAIITSYVFGSAITGFLMPENSFQLGREYGPLFLIGSFLFALACVTIYFDENSDCCFYLAAMACGLQNAITSKYSGNIIRTTHVTGTATDVGLVLGRMIRGNKKEFWKLQVLLPIYTAFLFGGVASVPAFKRLGKFALVINAVVFFSIGLAYSIVVGQQMHIPVWKAFFGAYSIVEESLKQGRQKVKKAAHKMHRTHVNNPLHTTTTEAISGGIGCDV